MRKWQDSRSQDPATGISGKHVSRVDTCTVATAKWHKTSALVRFPTTVSDRDTTQKKRRQTCCITSARNLANNVCHFVSLKWLVTAPAQHVNTPHVQRTIMCASRKTPVVGTRCKNRATADVSNTQKLISYLTETLLLRPCYIVTTVFRKVKKTRLKHRHHTTRPATVI